MPMPLVPPPPAALVVEAEGMSFLRFTAGVASWVDLERRWHFAQTILRVVREWGEGK